MNERERYCLGEALEVGTEPVLLIDDAYVEDRWGVYRHVNTPIKFSGNPVLHADMPWEGSATSPSVIYDDENGLFHMWYKVGDMQAWYHQFRLKDWKPGHGYPYYIAYARSRDGIHWEKPLFEDKPYGRYKATNVIMTGREKAQGVWVFPNHPSSGQPGKYMMNYKDNVGDKSGALCLAYSDDGVHWREDPGNPVFHGLRDTRHNLMYDGKEARWLLYTRPMCYAGDDRLWDLAVSGSLNGEKPLHPEYIPHGENWKRRAAVSVGKTPQNLGYPRCILWPDERDEPDFDDFLVHRVGNHYLAFCTYMGAPPPCPTMTHLLSSYDGLHWSRLPERRPYVGLGREGDFDAGQASSAGPGVTVGDETYLYYYGSAFPQKTNENRAAIGLARIRRDRYVAQMGRNTGGFLLTREVRVEGKHLVVNITTADTRNRPADGSDSDFQPRKQGFCAELLSSPSEGPPRPIPGYTFAECTTQPADLIEHPIKWKGSSDLSALIGKSVFIRFFLQNTGLYSFRFLP